ncbi:MAG: PD-(D/E)XK nuclease family protein, partial [Elusimicrobia bacterium]|nr:PD-(D/E)XK nuclease family protein [Elusimicrobiota bacterium]
MIFDPRELNYSKIKTYSNCPFLFKHIYVEQKRPPISPQASLGLSVHKALEEFHSRGGNFDDLLQSYDGNWLNAGYTSVQEQVEYYSKGRQMLDNYWSAEESRKSKVVFVEKDFEFTHGQWRIKGTIDRIDRHPDNVWEIIDYKTGADFKTE